MAEKKTTTKKATTPAPKAKAPAAKKVATKTPTNKKTQWQKALKDASEKYQASKNKSKK